MRIVQNKIGNESQQRAQTGVSALPKKFFNGSTDTFVCANFPQYKERSYCHRDFLYTSVFLIFQTFFPIFFQQTFLPSVVAQTPQADTAQTSKSRVWLTVEVLERKPSLGLSASALNEYIPVVVVDSASNAYLYALSGEMVEVGAERTYFVSVVSGNDKRFYIQGSPVQIIRTGIPVEKDLVYQREFIIKETTAPDTALHLPERIVSDAPPSAKPGLKAEAATISYNADKLPDCPYIVQFCALSLEKDATTIRESLKGASVQDARVEPFKDISRGIQYYRVRAGCFTELSSAKTALAVFYKAAQRLRLGVVPIVVKQ